MTSLRPKAEILDRAFAGVYLAYLFGTAAFNREFARLNVELFGVPLFVGEATIGVLALLLVARGLVDRKAPFPTTGLTRGLAVYFLVGCGFAVFGLKNGYGLAVFRDFAMVYYLVFFFFTLFAVRGRLGAATVLHVIAVGSVLGSLVTIVFFLLAPSLSAEHAAPGYQALVAWIAAVWLALWRDPGNTRNMRALKYLGIGVSFAVIYLAAYRTMLPVMLATLALLAAWAIFDRPGWRRTRLARAAGGLSIVLLIVVGAVLLHQRSRATPDAPPDSPPETPLPSQGPIALEDAPEVLSPRWARGFGVEAFTEASLQFRMTAWRLAIEKIVASPLVGIGYGPSPGLHPDENCELASSPTSNCGNAHNTFLTLAMRMGLPVFAFFLAINGYVAVKLLKQSVRGPDESVQAPFLAGAYLSFMLYGLMSLFFESPYLSSLYWIVLALTWAVATGEVAQSGRSALVGEAGTGQASGPEPAAPAPISEGGLGG
jgi:hypothetical protein